MSAAPALRGLLALSAAILLGGCFGEAQQQP